MLIFDNLKSNKEKKWNQKIYYCLGIDLFSKCRDQIVINIDVCLKNSRKKRKLLTMLKKCRDKKAAFII
jgi:hypothetical protein